MFSLLLYYSPNHVFISIINNKKTEPANPRDSVLYDIFTISKNDSMKS